jgi:hypothetical protein
MEAYEIKSYEQIRPNLRIRLMDMRSNQQVLQNAVYIPLECGLSLVAYMKLPESVAEGGIANVPRDMAALDGTGEAQIMEDAVKGSLDAGGVRLCGIQDMLWEKDPENYLESGNKAESPIFVLTTEDGFLGASALFYPGVKEQISEAVGGDYFVLPSSIHEVLIIPGEGTMTPKEMAQMVKSINETEVSPKDRLCNRVMRYSASTQELCIAADPDRGREMER